MILYGLLGTLVITLAWWIISISSLINPILLPPPNVIFIEIINILSSKNYLFDLCLTIKRILLAYSISVLIGVPLGVLLGLVKPLSKLLELPIDFFRSIPATALYPLFMLFFGVGDKSKLSLVIFASSLVILIYAKNGVKNCSVLRLNVAKAMRLKSYEMLYRVILPESLPYIITGFRISMSLVLVLVVVLEMFTGNTPGIGKRIYDANQTFQIKQLYASIVIVGIIRFLLNKIIHYVEYKFVHWSGR